MGHRMRVLCLAASCSLFAQLSLADINDNLQARQSPTGVFPVVNGAGSLTVSGAGYWHKEIFADGEQPSLTAYDSSGKSFPDGQYRYEFRSSPQSDNLSPGYSSAPTPGSNKPQVVRGRFEVSGGTIILR